jgi:hypothetical protein
MKAPMRSMARAVEPRLLAQLAPSGSVAVLPGLEEARRAFGHHRGEAGGQRRKPELLDQRDAVGDGIVGQHQHAVAAAPELPGEQGGGRAVEAAVAEAHALHGEAPAPDHVVCLDLEAGMRRDGRRLGMARRVTGAHAAGTVTSPARPVHVIRTARSPSRRTRQPFPCETEGDPLRARRLRHLHVAAAMVKALGPEVPLAQVVLFRNLCAVPLLLVMALRAGGLHTIRPRHPRMHLQRAFFGMMGMVGAFHGYAHLPLATATALGFTMPLFLTGAVGGAARRKGGLAALDGGRGRVPRRAGHRAAGRNGGRAAGALGRDGADGRAGLGAGDDVDPPHGRGGGERRRHRHLVRGDQRRLSAIATLPVWRTPEGWQWALLIGIGLVSAVAQLLMTEAYRRGETTLLAPFEYAGIVWTSLLGIAIWAEWPDGWDLLGFAVLVGAGLFIWWRETRLGVKR